MEDIKNKVYLIGAGPGDYRLLSNRGLSLLKQADVVVYDRLVNPSLLSFINAKAEKIYVGKARGDHTFTQDNINEIIALKAQNGYNVVRLKGGDPFVFGRGGEEALYLKERDIDFEIIPGITSAISGPAYAGIPVTHRNISSSFHVITGHNADKLDYKHLAALEGTLVILMGLKNLKKITENLILSGLQSDTSVAVIHYGTTSDQITITGNLDNIAERVRKEKISPPVITVIGEVVSLGKELEWFDKGPLSRRRIMVTRPRRQRFKMGNMIENMGGEVLYYPTIKIEGPLFNDRIKNIFNSVTDFDWIFFTSANGVENFFAIMKKMNKDIRQLADTQFAVIGKATEKALLKFGIKADFMPDIYTSDKMVEEFVKEYKGVQSKLKILLPRTNIVDDELEKRFTAVGHKAIDVSVYKTTIPDIDREYLASHLQERKVDMLTFTSPSTVDNFRKMIGDEFSLVKDIPTACIGPVTADAARKNGFIVVAVADEYTVQGLVNTIAEYFKG